MNYCGLYVKYSIFHALDVYTKCILPLSSADLFNAFVMPTRDRSKVEGYHHRDSASSKPSEGKQDKQPAVIQEVVRCLDYKLAATS